MNNMRNIESLEHTLALIIQAKEMIREKLPTDIEFDQPIITRNEQGIITPNTINMIQGKAGSHKSRLVETFSSAIISPKQDDSFLGFMRPYYPAEKFLLLYIDTERNIKDQYPKALQRIIKQSGLTFENYRNYLDYISLIPIDRAMRLAATEGYINTLRYNHNKHLVIVLDVISDCISDFNQSSESMKLIDYMNVLINDYDVTFICVIHENPSSEEKARGHLGTELRNKASTVIQIGFKKRPGSREDSDVIKVRFLKNRVGRRPESFFSMYCSSLGGLREVDKEDAEALLERQTALKVTVEDIIEVLVEKVPIARHNLIDVIIDKFSVSRNTIIKRMNEILDMKKFDHNGKLYHIIPEKTGREVIYNLTWQDKLS